MNILKSKKEIGNKNHGAIKHMLHMVLCCGLPILIIFSLPFIAGISPVTAGVLGVIAPFICPVMMGGMFILMLRGNKHNCCDEKNQNTSNEQTSNNL